MEKGSDRHMVEGNCLNSIRKYKQDILFYEALLNQAKCSYNAALAKCLRDKNKDIDKHIVCLDCGEIRAAVGNAPCQCKVV